MKCNFSKADFYAENESEVRFQIGQTVLEKLAKMCFFDKIAKFYEKTGIKNYKMYNF
jgi:hypothetical protein